MVLSLNRLTGNYEVIQVELQHNHLLHLPQTRHLMASQRKISEIQAFDIETADDTGIRPKQAHELACRRVDGTHNLSYTSRDQKNHLRSKQQRELAFGQAGSMLKYFQDKIVENPSFHYELQYDCEEHISNIFWLDAKVANSEECCLMLEDAIESIGPKLEDKLNASASATNEPSKETSKEQENIDPNVQ
jgi:zinc finger SWIM domain-containing protein 3